MSLRDLRHLITPPTEGPLGLEVLPMWTQSTIFKRIGWEVVATLVPPRLFQQPFSSLCDCPGQRVIQSQLLNTPRFCCPLSCLTLGLGSPGWCGGCMASVCLSDGFREGRLPEQPPVCRWQRRPCTQAGAGGGSKTTT